MCMRIPLTKYGLPQVAVYPGAVLAAMVVLFVSTRGLLEPWAVVTAEAVLGAVLIWSLSFFRDPERSCPSDGNLLLAPADGTITDIETVVEDGFIGGKAVRIGIFLSIFSTHINRAPCNVKVAKITYRKGKHTNAMNPQSGRVNESNDLALVRTGDPGDRLLVRQISGAIARRIVCEASAGGELSSGEKFGMIKFGSRTELYLPVREEARCLVEIGDKVKAGLTALVRYERCQD
ncbi:MAG: phosphatidylserine decarboxylase family protein [Planctomycetes bacterium]|nr:phosphatidylserine decarboxylase family protein [Planctomycetota bacterium]